MKIGLVHKRFGVDGGTERFAEGLTRQLSGRGHEVVVFAASFDPRFTRKDVAQYGRLRFGRRGGALGTILLWLAAWWRVREPSFDVVLHLGRTGPGRAYRAGGGCHRAWYDRLRAGAKTGGERLALSVSLYHRFRLWHERKALRSAHVIVPSQLARQGFIDSYGALAANVVVLPNGVDLARFHPKNRRLFFAETRDAIGLNPEEVVLLFVGSDFERKGLDVAIEAAAQLLAEIPEIRLLVVGGDRRRPEYERLADQHGLRSHVTFLWEHERPEHLYAAADVLILPTRFDPFANVTLEALATGLPVVTSARNGAVEVLQGCPAAAVVQDPEDVAGTVAALRDMLDPSALHDRQEAARALTEQLGEGQAAAAWEAWLRSVGAARG